MRIYKGDRPCPGCGIPGNEKSRNKARELCHDCKEALEIGRDIKENDDGRYGAVSLAFHTAKRMIIKIDDDIEYGEKIPYVADREHEYNSKSLQHALDDFIKTLDVGKRPYEKKIIRISNSDGLASRSSYTLPMAQAKMLYKFWNQVCGFSSFIQNKSFLKGTNLLKGLNTGEIKLSDFEDRINNTKAKL